MLSNKFWPALCKQRNPYISIGESRFFQGITVFAAYLTFPVQLYIFCLSACLSLFGAVYGREKTLRKKAYLKVLPQTTWRDFIHACVLIRKTHLTARRDALKAARRKEKEDLLYWQTIMLDAALLNLHKRR